MLNNSQVRILILGCSGLIGHKLLLKLSERFDNVYGLMRKDKKELNIFPQLDLSRIIDHVDVNNIVHFEGVLHAVNPDVILNCIGITKRKIEKEFPLNPIFTNAYFPHHLANWAKHRGKRIIHFSTDCVFNGEIGNYDEFSLTTGEDVYGKTKALGEIRYHHTLTIRSSFIGKEIADFTELLEWFLAQKKKQIKGFTKAMYSGVSTTFMAKIIGDIIDKFPEMNGLYNLATPEPITKYDLLCLARESFNIDVDILPDESFSTMPTLNGNKLREKMNLTIPSWRQMMDQLAAEKYYLNTKR
jgi:dTDP-4-dehydrorhamnose reductase